MYGSLILAAFEEAGKEIRRTQKFPRAKHLSEVLQENYGKVMGDRMLVNYYDEAKRNREANFELRGEIVQALCEYLGFKDFKDFQKHYKGTADNYVDRIKYFGKDFLHYTKRNWYGLAVIGLVLLLIKIVAFGDTNNSEVNKRFMVWKENHYEEVPQERLMDYSTEELEDFREDLLRDFKKILAPNCNTEFFDARGRPLLWYGKNASGELEYFTALAKHPETKKSLDEITQYMIKNHICETY